ncbi:MAG TPA: phosphatase PAP2 family protein [Candidatus Saccharimonadales bacterium]|nr:phosphatase PAP2 family protein [Candidatus Saccharimonadales bacterium]
MIKIKQPISKWIGVVGTILSLAIYIKNPSFPTPDKLIIFLVFVFMIFGDALEALRRFGPFVVLILLYESFRSIADHLNNRVDYLTGPHFDSTIFGNLPTVYLQRWLWHGHVQWYDFVFYLPYFLHFILPLGLGIIVWKTRDKQFWHVMNTYLVVAFAAFLTFLAVPAAPPWLASQNHYIQPIERISSHVWDKLGIHDFPSVYNAITPNPVAAIPSLHAAWATLLFIFVYKLYGRRWAMLAAVYPILIFTGTVYQGEHYVFDVTCGIVYAVIGYLTVPRAMKFFSLKSRKLLKKRTVKAASNA